MMRSKIQEFTSRLEGISLQDLSTWPLALKIMGCLCIVTAFICLNYEFILKPKIFDLKDSQKQENELRSNFAKKHAKWRATKGKQLLLEKQQQACKTVLAKIPEHLDMPQLIENISQLATDSLILQSVRLQGENSVSFYVELPIEMSVRGNYHELAKFISRLVALPYLITLQNVVILETVDKQEDKNLILSMTLKAYQRSKSKENVSREDD